MGFEYYLAGSPIFQTSPNEAWKNDFTALSNEQFDNSSSVFDILEEYSFGSGSYVDTRARITTAVDSGTGTKLGDDFKNVIFKPDHDPIGIGTKLYFDTNYWLCTFSNSIKSLVNSCTVRRCNNVLKWVNSSGSVVTESAIIDYDFSSMRNRNSDVNTGQGDITVFCQQNTNSRKIKPNQRFLFGNTDNWDAYRVRGGGVRNFINNNTTNNASARLMELILEYHTLNTLTDDLVNGVADYNKTPFSGSGYLT
jgi:hypothetical protein